MNYFHDRKLINISFLIIVCLLGYLAFESYKSILRYQFDDDWVNHTHKVMESNERLLSDVKDAESNQRGYIITGMADFLPLYNKSRKDFEAENQLLKYLTRDNHTQQVRIDSIDRLVSHRFDILENYIGLRSKNGLQAIAILPDKLRGKKTMDSIRSLTSEINAAEQILLKERQRISYNNAVRSQWLFFISIVITGLLLSAIFLMLARQMKLRAKAQKELYNSNEWYSQTLISLGDGVIATTADHCISYLNKAAEELTQYKSAEALGLPVETVFNIINETSRNAVTVPTRRAIAEKRVVELDNHTILIRKDKSEMYIDDSAAPVYDINGKLLGSVLVFRNINEKTFANKRLKELNEDLEEKVRYRTLELQEEIQTRKKAEAEKSKLIEHLVETNKSLEQFLYIISHNFRRPVANILGLLNLIEKDESEAERDHDLGFLSAEVNHLDRVLKDLGDITSVLKNQTEHKEVVEINECLNAIIDSLEYEITKANARINNNVAPGEETFCIKSYLNSILLNLISNAIKYKDPERRLVIDINFSSDDTGDMLTIKDNGLGIDMKKNGDKVFGLYNRFHQHIDGKGLGLHISKTQMEMMEGKISVNSKPGQGSEFMLYFPKPKMI